MMVNLRGVLLDGELLFDQVLFQGFCQKIDDFIFPSKRLKSGETLILNRGVHNKTSEHLLHCARA